MTKVTSIQFMTKVTRIQFSSQFPSCLSRHQRYAIYRNIENNVCLYYIPYNQDRLNHVSECRIACKHTNLIHMMCYILIRIKYFEFYSDFFTNLHVSILNA